MSFDIANINKSVDLNPGEWVDEIQDNPDLRLKVRSIRYKPYRVALSAKVRKGGKKYQSDEGQVDVGVALGEPLAEHILLDWDGVTSDGKPIPYSMEAAKAILTADDPLGIGQAFRDAVWSAGNSLAERLAAETKAASGN